MDAKHYDHTKILKLRHISGLSQVELAGALGVHKMTILRAEKGRPVSFNLILKLAAAFDVPIKTLLHSAPKATPKRLKPAVARARTNGDGRSQVRMTAG